MTRKSSQLYEQVKPFKFSLCNEVVEVVSKPGLPDWDQLPPSTALLAVHSRINPTDRVLLFGCHHGALSAFIARHLPQGELFITDNNFIALEMTRRTLTANNIAPINLRTDINLPQSDYHSFDTVYIQLPKGRKLTRRWLIQAHLALKPGGILLIAGSNKSGIQSCIKDAIKLYGNGQILGYKKGNRVYRSIKIPEATLQLNWVDDPGIAVDTWVEFSVSIPGQSFRIRSLPGVFSFDHLDAGTRMLISVCDITPESKVLDVGCGYGMIGMYAAIRGAGWVDLVDNDLLAVASCKETLALNRVNNAAVFASDLLDSLGSKKYDHILSNPPFHAGQAVDYQIAEALIRQSYQALNPNGRITIVANRFISYDNLINDIFNNVTCLAETGRFHVLSGIKSRKLA